MLIYADFIRCAASNVLHRGYVFRMCMEGLLPHAWRSCTDLVARALQIEGYARFSLLLRPPASGIVQDTTLPAFDKIKAEHVVPGIRELLAQLNADIDALEQDVVPTWAGLVEPIERIFDRLERAWGAVSHLKVGRVSSHDLAPTLHCLHDGSAVCVTVTTVRPHLRQPLRRTFSAQHLVSRDFCLQCRDAQTAEFHRR